MTCEIGIFYRLLMCPCRTNAEIYNLGLHDQTVAAVAQLAEHHVANVIVVGSNPISRSFLSPPISVRFVRLYFHDELWACYSSAFIGTISTVVCV